MDESAHSSKSSRKESISAKQTASKASNNSQASKDTFATNDEDDENEQKMSAAGRPDTLNTEFVYYSSVLKDLCGTLTNDLDKKRILPWTKKLFRPEYHSSQFREKRNKFLLQLTISLFNDEAFGIFIHAPPQGALPELESMPKPEFPPAEWELDQTWSDTVKNLSDDFQTLTCSVHCMQEDCDEDHQLDNILDQEFQFFLYLLRPYAAMLPNVYDRTRVATWMQTLCSITGTNMCSSMRGIRNDYVMALLSFASNLRLAGPFTEYPPIRKLPPLAEAVKLAPDFVEPTPITDPAGPDANEFLAQQPVPDEGAFCYIALTGDLIDSSLPNMQPAE